MEAQLAALAAQLEGSGLGDAMRGGVRNLYAIVNVAHILGVILLVGGIGAVDLRVMGFGRRIPIGALSKMLTPLAVAGLLIQVISGFMLFAADAGPLTRSAVFLTKIGMVALALVNALCFRALFPRIEHGADPPNLARAMAAASIALWLTAGCLGRLIAYS